MFVSIIRYFTMSYVITIIVSTVTVEFAHRVISCNDVKWISHYYDNCSYWHNCCNDDSVSVTSSITDNVTCKNT